jgi:hypothetical protein
MMCIIMHPISFTQLWLKVVKITQERQMPFQNGVLRWEWFRWSKNYNLDLSFRVAWGMEVGCAKGLCLINVT